MSNEPCETTDQRHIVSGEENRLDSEQRTKDDLAAVQNTDELISRRLIVANLE